MEKSIKSKNYQKKCADISQRNNLPTFIYYLRLYLDIS